MLKLSKVKCHAPIFHLKIAALGVEGNVVPFANLWWIVVKILYFQFLGRRNDGYH